MAGTAVKSGAVAVAILVPVFALSWPLGLPGMDLTMPGVAIWALVIAMGALGTLAHLLMTWSLRFAPSATLAPMQYLEIPFATLIGWLIWRDLPDGLAAIGILITVASGLYIVLRERQLTRAGAKMASAAQSQP